MIKQDFQEIRKNSNSPPVLLKQLMLIQEKTISGSFFSQNARIVHEGDFPAMFEPLIDYLKEKQGA